MRAARAAKTHCKRGHLLSPENVTVRKGSRHCILCNRIRCLEYHRSLGKIERLPWKVRVETKSVKTALGCWQWSGEQSGKTLQVDVDGKVYSLLRLVYSEYVGVIPEGFNVVRTCENGLCVNPDHLEAISSKESTRRGQSPSGKNAAKTCCHKGHPLEGDNLHIEPSGSRRCKTCRRVTVRKCKCGITELEYNALVDQQENRCAICRQPETTKNRDGEISTLSVDHDHNTGRLRALLCRRCNTSVALLREDIGYATSLVEYLKQWSDK